ncbi:glyoxylate carboligase (tartronate-semialdehyde synthase) [Escherichia coli]|uniref:Glyoxylate carboligase (Tartronate-semialdehyde synthase) n=1 Tax=Escherichia coli TaxID=562 RepID=A0A377KAG8_ECOLX|nr:glyoxylate carboligase (tartronate-semialdehyde synthase) [Escherichia coli]
MAAYCVRILALVSDAKAALTLLVEVAQEMQKAGRLPCRKEWVADCQQRKRTLLRKNPLRQRAGETAARV